MDKLLALLKEEEIYERLLKYGLFSEKLDGIFQSVDFGNFVIKNKPNPKKSGKYSTIKYRLTRNNNAPRILEIPHPIGYYKLCIEIKNNWSRILKKIGEINDYSRISMVIPKINNLNKRLVSLQSYDRLHDNFLTLDKSFGKKYLVHSDITNFFPSIYSHSISWALVGHRKAKESINDNEKWFNKLDNAVRSIQRNETNGIAIGPDTSSIISELILSRIDKELKKYDYIRFIDDYKCYCKTKEEGENFLRELSKALEKYNLRINTKKTEIKELPIPFNETWLRKLKDYSNNFLKSKEYTKKDVNKITEFIDLAIDLSKKWPTDSPLKYCVKILAGKKYEDEEVFTYVFMYLSRISYLYPYFIDSFDKLLRNNNKLINKKVKQIIEEEINLQLNEHIKHRRSDALIWCLKIALEFELKIIKFKSISDKITDERDCLPSLLCYLYSKKFHPREVSKYFKLIEELKSESLEDEWWVYIYELYCESPNKPAFKTIQHKEFYNILKEEKISFLNKKLRTLLKK